MPARSPACKLASIACVALVVFCAYPQISADETPLVVQVNVSTITETGMPKSIVQKGAKWNFGPGALQTYRGWQYAAFWDTNRQVSVARRPLPQGVWECVSLDGYQRTSNVDRGKAGPKSQGFGDGHEKVAMGISSDGVIHLAFDHHVSTLHYRSSQTDVANRPTQIRWSKEIFGAVQDNLGGPRIDSVTYPNFVRDGDHMSLYVRLNTGSGSADSHFFEYRKGDWIVNDSEGSKIIDKHWSGGNGTVNAYPHTMVVDQGRRHLTWCWRDTPDARTCHDLCYAYSDDQGQTWKNNAGQIVGKRGSQFISADTPGIAVLEIPPGSSYVNGGSMTVDDSGDIHVLMKGPNQRPLIARRTTSTGNWQRSTGSTLGVLVTCSPELFVVAESGLYRAKRKGLKTLAKVGPSIEDDCQDSRYAVDRQRWHHDKVISVIGQHGTKVVAIDFVLDQF